MAPSLQALQLMADLLEEAESTASICEDLAPKEATK